MHTSSLWRCAPGCPSIRLRGNVLRLCRPTARGTVALGAWSVATRQSEGLLRVREQVCLRTPASTPFGSLPETAIPAREGVLSAALRRRSTPARRPPGGRGGGRHLRSRVTDGSGLIPHPKPADCVRPPGSAASASVPPASGRGVDFATQRSGRLHAAPARRVGVPSASGSRPRNSTSSRVGDRATETGWRRRPRRLKGCRWPRDPRAPSIR